MREIRITSAGLPPAKNEAKSMLAAGHVHQPRVMALLLAAREALGDHAEPAFPTGPLGLELTLESPEEPLADATNFMGGVADVLEAKGRRGALPHLADLASVAVFGNDRQLQLVQYRWDRASEARYTVRVWARET